MWRQGGSEALGGLVVLAVILGGALLGHERDGGVEGLLESGAHSETLKIVRERSQDESLETLDDLSLSLSPTQCGFSRLGWKRETTFEMLSHS